MEVDYVRVYQDAQAYPYVRLDAPTDGLIIESGTPLSLAAAASDSGAVERVEFLQDGGILSSVSEPPYVFEIEHAVDGCYSLRARAVDDAGFSAESDPAEVVVGSGCPNGHRWPFLVAPSAIPGKIEAEYYDKGGQSVAYFDLSPINEGNGIRQSEGVDLRQSRDNGGGFDISNITAREWVTYSIDVAEPGRYVVVARSASYLGGRLDLSVDGEDLLGEVEISPSGGDFRYSNTILGEIDLEAGIHSLRIDMRSSGFSLNWLNFTPIDPTSSAQESPGLGFRVEVSPNPSVNRIHVTGRFPKPTRLEIVILDILGRPVLRPLDSRAVSNEFMTDIDVSSLPSGSYLLVIRTETGIHSRRMVVTN
jgi:hypothetical protein